MVDQSSQVKHKFAYIFINHWAMTLNLGLAKNLVYIENTINIEKYTLSSEDAFKLFIYVLYKKNGFTLTTFPRVKLDRVINPILNLYSESVDHITEVSGLTPHFNQTFAKDLLSHIPKYTEFNSVVPFKDFIFSVYVEEIRHWLIESNISSSVKNGYCVNMINRLFVDGFYIPNDESVDLFFDRLNLPLFDHYTEEQYDVFLYDIMDSALDHELKKLFTLKDIQKAMSEIFKKLMSYSIQFLDVYISENAFLSNLKDVRYDVNKNIVKAHSFYGIYNLNVDIQNVIKESYDYSMSKSSASYNVGVHLQQGFSINPNVNIGLKDNTSKNKPFFFPKGFLEYRSNNPGSGIASLTPSQRDFLFNHQ
jgi:hypothetical protein